MCSDPQRNVDFYVGILALKLVKVTVNFDDPGSYHLYYGDGLGRAGTLLTFFPWPDGPPGQIGAAYATITSFAVPKDALAFWRQRLGDHSIEFESLDRFGFPTLRLRDPDNGIIEIVESIDEPLEWGSYGELPREVAIHGFHHVQLHSIRPDATEALLTEAMNYRKVQETEEALFFEIQSDVPYGRYVELLKAAGRSGRMGTGITHHVAFRVADDEAEAEFRQTVLDRGLRPTEFIDRTYFHSIYFRDPGAILFEIATDGPGQTINETPEEFGTRLMLPPWFEPQRAEIQAGLPSFTAPNGVTFPGGAVERV